MIRHFLSKQFLGFAAVGGLAALIHWLSRIALSHWLSFPVAVILAYGVGITVAFVLYRVFVFPKSKKPMRKQVRDFVIINLAFLPVVLATAVALKALFRSVGYIAYPEAVAHGVAVVVPALATFLIYKFYAFQDTDNGRK